MTDEFDPAAFDAQEAESGRPLKEVSSNDIALETLKAVCRKHTTTREEAESLWADVKHLYQLAANIEEKTLGRESDQQGKMEARSLIEREGADLFKQFNNDIEGSSHA